MLALWIIGGIAFLALRDGDESNDNVAVPTQPPSTSIAPPTTSTTTRRATTTTTHPPVTTTAPPPTITVITAAAHQAPTTAPPTTPPTAPPTTVVPPPTSAVDHRAATTTKPPPSTTTPQQAAAKVQAKAARRRSAPATAASRRRARRRAATRRASDLVVTWAINNGDVGEHCRPARPRARAADRSRRTTTSTTTTTTQPDGDGRRPPPTTTLPRQAHDASSRLAPRRKEILQSIKPQIAQPAHLDITGMQLIGTYPIEAAGDERRRPGALQQGDACRGNLPAYKKMFDVPPAEVVQCLNPAFELQLTDHA